MQPVAAGRTRRTIQKDRTAVEDLAEGCVNEVAQPDTNDCASVNDCGNGRTNDCANSHANHSV